MIKCIGLLKKRILCKRFMEKDNFLFKNFPTLTLNQFYSLLEQDLFPGMTKNVLLTFIYILIIQYI